MKFLGQLLLDFIVGVLIRLSNPNKGKEKKVKIRKENPIKKELEPSEETSQKKLEKDNTPDVEGPENKIIFLIIFAVLGLPCIFLVLILQWLFHP